MEETWKFIAEFIDKEPLLTIALVAGLITGAAITVITLYMDPEK